MKRAILILILCAVFLSACGNAAETAERSVSVDTSAVSQTTTAVTVSAVTSAKEEKDTSEATTTTFKTSSQTVSETSKPTNITVTTTKESDPSGYSGNSSQGQNNSAQNNNGQENNHQPVQNDPQPDNSPSDNNRSNNGAEQNNEPSATQSTTAKPSSSAVSAVTNPPDTTTKPQTTKVPQTQPPLPVPTEEERYMDIGRSLSHNGSDYSKAEAVYNWMTENGSGTCVNYSWQTYYLCKGTGLECYLAWTPSKLYGHVANVVKVNGTWFVIDTQGQGFLLNNDCGFSEIIDIDESYVSVADLISNQRYDEIY